MEETTVLLTETLAELTRCMTAFMSCSLSVVMEIICGTRRHYLACGRLAAHVMGGRDAQGTRHAIFALKTSLSL